MLRFHFFFWRIWKLLVAYKHTYFVQRNRMKCGHSRNLFYVSRSCFSFYLHTFLTHLNKWNTCWDFIFFRHLKTTCGRRRPAGRQRWRRCPARCGRPSTRTTRCTDASGYNGPRTVNHVPSARLVRCVNARTVLWLYWAVSHHRMCRASRVKSKYVRWMFMWSSSCTFLNTLLVAYKHTYFVQRNRMKCGHSRNLFYVSRSCFSFYLHTFLTHLNKWNTCWDFIFFRHLTTFCI